MTVSPIAVTICQNEAASRLMSCAAAADPSISAVVADSPWTDQDLQLSRLSFLPIGSLRVPLPPYGIAAVNALVGADVTKARPLDAIARISPRPILLIHSADDDNATTPVEGCAESSNR